MDEKEGPVPLAVVRCDSCGDTFPTDASGDTKCPSCGSTDVHPAAEPLL